MSTGQFAVLGEGRMEARSSDDSDIGSTRAVTLGAFMLLAVYGGLRWSTMLARSPGGRMFGLLVLTLIIAWLGGHLSAPRLWARVAAIAGIVLAALAMFPVAGFPVVWLLGLHFGRLAGAIGNGLSALPHAIVPYDGTRADVRGVILLGAGMLLLAGALALCSSRRRLGQVRLVAAAVPLVVLAIVPSALAEPRLAGVHGVIMFLLLMGLLFSERVSPRRSAGAFGFAAIAALAALILSPAIETSHALINVKTIGAGHVRLGERFDWAQTYGPLNWPNKGSSVLSVQARFPSYWKAEDVDLFNGSDWVSTDVAGAGPTLGVYHSSLARWTEPLTVTLGTMSTSQVVAAGVASEPQSSAFTALPGNGPGTWETVVPMGPNTSYRVDVYSPSPSRDQLAAAAPNYPMSELAPELQLILPNTAATQVLYGAPASPVQFTGFGSRYNVEPYGGLSRSLESGLVRTSPYAPAFRLAMRLRAHAHTPYAYLEAILRYLTPPRFTYDQVATAGRYPLLNFLFKTHTGYCQQFAGAMALLLRMGGVPARVAAGFTTGVLAAHTHTYSVSDLDAHSWVEAWFAGYGWVTFDPTPPSDPALSGHIALPAGQSSPAVGGRNLASSVLRSHRVGAAAPTGPRHQSQPVVKSSPRSASAWPFVLAALGLVLLIGLFWLRHRRPRTPEAAIEELERAFSRCGRPLRPGMTLAGLEHRLAGTPDAAAYVRTLSAARYAGAAELPSSSGRRALRRRLRQGLGPLGWLHALFALPPLSGPSATGKPGARALH